MLALEILLAYILLCTIICIAAVMSNRNIGELKDE